MNASNVLIHLIKRRIAPIIERHLGESQMDFRKGKDTRDAVFQLRIIKEKMIDMNTEKVIQGKNVKKRKNYTYASWITRKHLTEENTTS